MTFLQPPGHVHAMTWATRQPFGVEIRSNGSAACGVPGVDFSAQASESGDTVVVRLLNANAVSTAHYSLDVALRGGGGRGRLAVRARTIGGVADLTASNTPARPNAIVPRLLPLPGDRMPVPIALPANSYTVVTVTRQQPA